MARTNKYTSLNFNDIFDKNTSTSTATSRSHSSSPLPHKSYSLSASSRLGHGGMLVLSRPSVKPQPPPQPQPHPHPQSHPPPQPQLQPLSSSVDFPAITSPQSTKPLDSESTISLRPQGKTGGTPSFQEREISNKVVDVPSPKSNKFVPPHLRPGFVPREVPAVPDFQKPRPGNHHRPGSAHGNYHGSPNRYGDDARSKSGGGYHPPGSAHGSANVHGDDGRPNSGGGYHRPGSAHGSANVYGDDGWANSGGGYHRPGVFNAYGDDGRPNSGGGYNRPVSAHGNYHGSTNGYADDLRPNSGGGYDRRMRGAGPGAPPFAAVESESFLMNRPRSGGSRPCSSG